MIFPRNLVSSIKTEKFQVNIEQSESIMENRHNLKKNNQTKCSFSPYYLRVIKIASSDELHAPTHRSCVQNARVRGQTRDNPPLGGQCRWKFDQ